MCYNATEYYSFWSLVQMQIIWFWNFSVWQNFIGNSIQFFLCSLWKVVHYTVKILPPWWQQFLSCYSVQRSKGLWMKTERIMLDCPSGTNRFRKKHFIPYMVTTVITLLFINSADTTFSETSRKFAVHAIWTSKLLR